MLATILITSHNYAKYLPEAIESALNQTYEPVEVLVVDDGSTDGSRAIVEGYGGRLRAVYQENAGQRVATNTGIGAADGEIICLLDADDAFRRNKVARVAEAFRDPDVVLVYHQIQPVAADGVTSLGKPVPRGVWRGDIRARATRAGGWWPRPTTSALSFRKSFLERVVPIPVGEPPIWADTYLAGLAPFAGHIVGIAEPLGILRLHGENAWSRGAVTSDGDARHVFETRRDQYAMEFHALVSGLHDRLGLGPPLSLDDHLRFQQYRNAAGEDVSRGRVARMALRCPTLPPSMRWREAVKIALRRW